MHVTRFLDMKRAVLPWILRDPVTVTTGWSCDILKTPPFQTQSQISRDYPRSGISPLNQSSDPRSLIIPSVSLPTPSYPLPAIGPPPIYPSPNHRT